MHLPLHFAHLASSRRGAYVDRASDLLTVDSGLACDTFNVVIGARLDARTADARIDQVRAQFDGRPFSWWVGPDDRPTDLAQRLAQAGFGGAEDDVVMDLDLAWTVLPPFNAPPGFVMRPVTTRADLDVFARILAANWSPPDENVLRFYADTAAAALAPDCPQRFFLGTVDGQPVAVCELCLGFDGVAGIYNVGTLAAHRRRGFGSAMTRHAIDIAAARGLRRVALQASADGLSIYEALGFTRRGTYREFKPYDSTR